MSIEISNAKPVRRSDLVQDGSDTEDIDITDIADPKVTAVINPTEHSIDDVTLNYGFDYDLVDHKKTAPSAKTENKSNATDDVDELFSFNLFRPKQNVKTLEVEAAGIEPSAFMQTHNRISLRSPSPDKEKEGRFVQPSKPLYHFLTTALPEAELSKLRQQYEDVAFSGDEIAQRNRSTRWPGSYLPWRVIHVPASNLIDKTTGEQIPARPSKPGLTDAKTISRKRSSKKRRIWMRKRVSVRNQLQATLEKTLQAQQEKRTKKNRQKKVKRKEKEKQKKLEAAQANTDTSIKATEITS